ncbi:MAG: twin-arginine translocation signal domain-containing protein, partial [Chloroflexi bacterium]
MKSQGCASHTMPRRFAEMLPKIRGRITEVVMPYEGSFDHTITRRSALKAAAAAGLALSTQGLVELLALPTKRMAMAAPNSLPDIQFDIRAFVPPAQTVDGVIVRFGPVFTRFVTATLTRRPSLAEQQRLSAALATIESIYPFSPGGVFVFTGYGIPYFSRLRGGMRGALVRRYVPRLRSSRNRLALEEAVISPTDVAPGNPAITKATYSVPVAIEANDILFTVRSDVLEHATDVIDWLLNRSHQLRGRFVPSPEFTGLLAAARVSDRSPMWMGFADQQASGSGPPEITTFQGNKSASLTTCRASDYLGNGAIQHLSHVILDLDQFYAVPDEPFTERVQYAFRSNPIPALGNADQFSGGGGPAFLDNLFQGANDARANAAAIKTFQGEHRMGHLAALQRSSRAADGTPIHIRMDGPGYDPLDVPDGSAQP